jgi:PAS domain S-box-containing protein
VSEASVDEAEVTAGTVNSALAGAELFEALTLYSGDIISLLDEQGRLLYNSPATIRINGFTPSELANVDTFSMIHPDDRATVSEVFRRVLHQPGSVHTVQYRYKTKDGRWLWMEAIASNQLDNPAVRGVVANSRDISERVAADMERARLQAQSLHMQKLESLGVLAGGIAHDFNNLLMVMLGEADLLAQGNADPTVQDAAERIQRAAERASELTQLLLAYAGKGRLEFAVTDLVDLFAGLKPLLSVTVGQRSRLLVEVDPDAAWVDADGRQLRQVVLNLVQNAAESATRPLELRVGVHGVQLDSAAIARLALGEGLQPGRYWAIEVRDDGDGLPESAFERVFDPFFSTKQTGRGLGLSAVAGIVRAHGAGLGVQSRVGVGTTFTVYLREGQAPALQRPARSRHDEPAVPRRVLVVDDDVAAAETTARILARAGLLAHTSPSGEHALHRLRSKGEPFDLVVLDMIMPGMDGSATFQQLRQLRPQLPVLFCSGFDDDIAQQCLGEPKTAFLHKPFQSQRLLTRVRELCDSDGSRVTPV